MIKKSVILCNLSLFGMGVGCYANNEIMNENIQSKSRVTLNTKIASAESKPMTLDEYKDYKAKKDISDSKKELKNQAIDFGYNALDAGVNAAFGPTAGPVVSKVTINGIKGVRSILTDDAGPMVGAAKQGFKLFTKLLFGGASTPDAYMEKLEDIQKSIDRLDEKMDISLGLSKETLVLVKNFYESYLKNEISNQVRVLQDYHHDVEKKANEIYSAISKVNGNADLFIDTNVNINGIVPVKYELLDPYKAYKFAEKTIKEINEAREAGNLDLVNNQIELVKALDGEVDGSNQISQSAAGFTRADNKKAPSIHDLYEKYLNEKQIGYVNQLNMNLATILKKDSKDLTAPWFSVNNVINKETSKYLVTLSIINNIQTLQLAFYYASSKLYPKNNIIEKFTKEEQGINGLAKVMRSKSVDGDGQIIQRGAYNKGINEYILKFKDQFGEIDVNGKYLGGNIHTNIPPLDIFLASTYDPSGQLFADKDLLNECTISGFALDPIAREASSKAVYTFGRLTMKCAAYGGKGFIGENNIGIDIPLKYQNSKLSIDSLQGIHYDKYKNYLLPGYYDANGDLQGGIKDFNLFAWDFYTSFYDINSIEGEMEKNKNDDTKVTNSLEIRATKYDDGFKTKSEYRRYQINPSLGINVVNDSGPGQYPKYLDNWDQNYVRKHSNHLYFPYQNNVKDGDKSQRAWSEKFLFNAEKSGHLFLLNNYFGVNLPRYIGNNNPGQRIQISCLGGYKYTSTGTNTKKVVDNCTSDGINLIFNDGTTITNKKTNSEFDQSGHKTSFIDTNIAEAPIYIQQYNPNEYEEWQSKADKSTLSYAYMDGTLSFKKGLDDQIILTSPDGKSRLIYTESSGTLKLEMPNSSEQFLKLRKSAGGSYKGKNLSLVNGDFMFYDDDITTATYLLRDRYDSESTKGQWVGDNYAKIMLDNNGVVTITSEAREIDSFQKLGVDGIIYKADHQWWNQNKVNIKNNILNKNLVNEVVGVNKDPQHPNNTYYIKRNGKYSKYNYVNKKWVSTNKSLKDNWGVTDGEAKMLIASGNNPAYSTTTYFFLSNGNYLRHKDGHMVRSKGIFSYDNEQKPIAKNWDMSEEEAKSIIAMSDDDKRKLIYFFLNDGTYLIYEPYDSKILRNYDENEVEIPRSTAKTWGMSEYQARSIVAADKHLADGTTSFYYKDKSTSSNQSMESTVIGIGKDSKYPGYIYYFLNTGGYKKYDYKKGIFVHGLERPISNWGLTSDELNNTIAVGNDPKYNTTTYFFLNNGNYIRYKNGKRITGSKSISENWDMSEDNANQIIATGNDDKYVYFFLNDGKYLVYDAFKEKTIHKIIVDPDTHVENKEKRQTYVDWGLSKEEAKAIKGVDIHGDNKITFHFDGDYELNLSIPDFSQDSELDQVRNDVKKGGA